MAININPKNKGELHRDLGVPVGKPISAAELMNGLHSKSGAVRKRANFAKNAKKWAK